MTDSFIEIMALTVGAVYRLRSRNLAFGVYLGDGRFAGIRTKFGNRFLDVEMEWTTSRVRGFGYRRCRNGPRLGLGLVFVFDFRFGIVRVIPWLVIVIRVSVGRGCARSADGAEAEQAETESHEAEHKEVEGKTASAVQAEVGA